MTERPTRRAALKAGSSAAAALLTWMSMPGFALAGDEADEELVPFLDTPRTPPNRLDWETLDEWLTPQDQTFSVQHYGIPEFDPASHQLEVGGLVEHPRTFSIDDLKSRPRKDVLMTLECAGNGSSKGFMNAVYNSKWTGTPLVPLLKECAIRPETIEVVFLGRDRQKETLRPKTKSELTIEVPFGRSMSLADVMDLDPLLAYERDGEPIETRNGAPLRLIVPGWYGVANVKWLTRIECRDRRYMGRFMGRDYVTVRGERQGDEVVFVETSVAHLNLKSVVARVTRKPTADGKIPIKAAGAAWDDGTGVAKVEVKLDDGPWREAVLADAPRSKFSWVFFSIDLGRLDPGKHTIVSRAIDVNGRIQPSADDDEIALKRTYWEAYAQWPRSVDLEA
ncbi:MAG TPA: molybdopterin-dependent oxidoreductase [Isosphaeraceae bacterium]|nr:molybdopterin-dependent oxidoreductase [Isosphaeraceae bacterium]